MKRFWMRYYVSGDVPKTTFHSWISGWGGDDGEDAIVCALVDADTEADAWAKVETYYHTVERDFCNQKPGDWTPGDRFLKHSSQSTTRES